MILNRCKKCSVKGFCCYNSVLIEGFNIILPNHYCKYLNIKTKKCTIYKKRFKLRKDCQTAKSGAKNGALPEGCLYLKKYKSENIKPKINYLPNELSKHGRITFEYYNNKPHKEISKY